MTICKNEICEKQANFGNKGDKPQYCATHKLNSMIDLKHKKCKCGKRPFWYAG